MPATGKISQVIGATFDAEFPESELPAIYNAIRIEQSGGAVPIRLTGEVQQHLGGSKVRCIALGATEGLVRGMAVEDTGSPVKMPVGECVLGRVLDLHAADEALGGPQGDAADLAAAQVLLDLARQVDGRGASLVVDADGVVDGRQRVLGELRVERRADHLADSSLCGHVRVPRRPRCRP